MERRPGQFVASSVICPSIWWTWISIRPLRYQTRLSPKWKCCNEQLPSSTNPNRGWSHSDSAFVNSVVNLSVVWTPGFTDFTWQQGNPKYKGPAPVSRSLWRWKTSKPIWFTPDPKQLPWLQQLSSIRWIIPKYNVDIPNAFTPDGDGLNDRFAPLTYAAPNWKTCWFSTDLANWSNKGNSTDGWDGTQGGQRHPRTPTPTSWSLQTHRRIDRWEGGDHSSAGSFCGPSTGSPAQIQVGRRATPLVQPNPSWFRVFPAAGLFAVRSIWCISPSSSGIRVYILIDASAFLNRIGQIIRL